MTARTVLVLPDAWRIELLLSPEARRAWLGLGVGAEALPLLDWESWRFSPGDTLACLRLDLAAAELVLKVPESVRVACVRSAQAPRGRSARARLLTRATARVALWVEGSLGDVANPAAWVPGLLAPLRKAVP